ncbi:MAG: MFS transporter [Spirochaetales bacterium]|nr:MFS transporter [Spirochaetales bacterium]
MTQKQALKKSLKLYSLYALLSRAYFWMPVFILYFSSLLSLKDVFLLEAVYYVTVFVTEVPSGWFSDTRGRKTTLLLSGSFLVMAYTLFILGNSFFTLAIAQIFLGMGFSFASGTDTSLHLALLEAKGKESEYGKREGKLGALSTMVAALASILGGTIAWLGAYRWAYVLSLFFALLSLLITTMIQDPEKHCVRPKRRAIKQFIQVGKRLSHPRLRFVFVFTVIITVLNHTPYELYQPYAKTLGILSGSAAPLLTGIHAALASLIAAFAAGQSFSLREKIGTKALLISALVLQTLLIGALMIPARMEVFLLLLLRGVPGPLTTPAVRSESAPYLPSEERATFFSLQSLAGRAAFALTLVAYNQGKGDAITGSAALGLTVALLGGLLLLFLPMSPKKEQ